MAESYRALVVTEGADGSYTRQVLTRDVSELPPNEALIRVRYSSLNYKDALSASGNRGVTRNYPHTPGIDAAGELVEGGGDVAPGSPVIVTGYDLGANTSGGFAEYIRVPAAWMVALPAGLTLRESMIIGTAGLTAALAAHHLLRHDVAPGRGEVLVTGASGGVGCWAVALLAAKGYSVVAATGKDDAREWLQRLGATRVLSRADVTDTSGKALLKERWAGVVDAVGGDMLATALKSVVRSGCVVACGNAASPQLTTTVYPFILRGVTLQGADSAEAPMALRRTLWRELASTVPSLSAVLDSIAQETTLDGLDPFIEAILQGTVRGRVVVKV
jgi:putative YhdH/YhfP family quinone oxidoreductase